MAIVAEDLSMVKFLLLCGADVHQRCCGNFFRPDDQKNKAVDSVEQECPLLPIQSNYAGLSYFGEYPLSFAAVTKQEDCVRILLARGADPNRQDSNGNTVLHMLVIHNVVVTVYHPDCQMISSKLLSISGNVSYHAEFRCSLGHKKQPKPDTLYARSQTRTQRSRLIICSLWSHNFFIWNWSFFETFDLIVNHLKTVYLIYGDIECAACPLSTLDTITGKGTDTNSALYLIVNGVRCPVFHKKSGNSLKIFTIWKESEQHLELLDGFVSSLLQLKWSKFAKKQYFNRFRNLLI